MLNCGIPVITSSNIWNYFLIWKVRGIFPYKYHLRYFFDIFLYVVVYIKIRKHRTYPKAVNKSCFCHYRSMFKSKIINLFHLLISLYEFQLFYSLYCRNSQLNKYTTASGWTYRLCGPLIWWNPNPQSFNPVVDHLGV